MHTILVSFTFPGVYWGEKDLFNSIKCDLFIVFSRVIDFEWISILNNIYLPIVHIVSIISSKPKIP